MTIQMPDDYYNRHDPAKHYEKHLVRAKRGAQSAEINEIQENLLLRQKAMGDAIFKDGDIVRDCQARLDSGTGVVSLASGALYLLGAVRGVPSATFTVPINTVVQIGIRLVTTVVSELEDPDLRDPATGTVNFDEPGADRLKIEPTWGWDGDEGDGDFYPIYTVDNGILLGKEPPPSFDSLTTAISVYDRDSTGGEYIIAGLKVSAVYDRVENKVTVMVSEGRARVNGYPVIVPRSIRQSYDADPDSKVITAEPHTFTDGGGGTMRVDLNHTPLLVLDEVRATVRRTVTLTHGAFSGAMDALPNNSVVALQSVTQGVTTYSIGVDCKLTDDQVDWSLAGAEPAPGSTYSVTFDFISTAASGLTTTGQDDTGFTLGTSVGAIVGSSVFQVDYSFAMPRIDAIVLGIDGRVSRLIGVSNQYSPAEPGVPETQLRLAGMRHSWDADPTIASDAVVVMPMDELQGMRSMIFDLYDLVAQERLRNDISLADPASKRGVFVDPFTNDNARDQGVSQSLAIVDGELRLAIAPDVHSVGTSITSPELLPYTLETIIEQPYRTGTMLVNPYMAFDPIPADLTLRPAVDFWTEVEDVWESPITNRFVNGLQAPGVVTSVGLQVVNTNSRPAELLRQITVNFTIQGFGAGEVLNELTFDGIPVTPENP